MSIVEQAPVETLELTTREEWERSIHERWQDELAVHALAGIVQDSHPVRLPHGIQQPILTQQDSRIDIGSWRAYADEEFQVPEFVPTDEQLKAADKATEMLAENIEEAKRLLDANLSFAIEHGHIPAFAQRQHYAALDTQTRILATKIVDLKDHTKAFRDENDGTTTVLAGLTREAQLSKILHELLGHGAAGSTFIVQDEYRESGVLAKGDKSFAGIQSVRAGDSTRLMNPKYNPELEEGPNNEKYIYTNLALEEAGAETAKLGLATRNFEMDPRKRNDPPEIDPEPHNAVNARIVISSLYEMSQGLMDPKVFLRSRYRNSGPNGGDSSADVRERTRQERAVWGRGFRRKANDLAMVVFEDTDFKVEEVEAFIKACVKPPVIQDGKVIKQGEILDIKADKRDKTKKLETILRAIKPEMFEKE
jgi:hypothetical protein